MEHKHIIANIFKNIVNIFHEYIQYKGSGRGLKTNKEALTCWHASEWYW